MSNILETLVISFFKEPFGSKEIRILLNCNRSCPPADAEHEFFFKK